MRSVGVAALGLLLSSFAFCQTPDSNFSRIPPSVNSAPSAPQTQQSAAQTQQPPNYANYSIMLVSPTGGGVVLMHNPKGELEYVDVNNTKRAFAAGYVPARVSEIAALIGSLKEEIDQLTAENRRLQNTSRKTLNEANCHTYDWLKNATVEQLRTCAALYPYPASNPATPPSPSPADLAAQRDAQIEAEKTARRQQLLQTWMMLQNMNRPQTQNLNVNVTDCTRLPALCAGR